MSNHTNKIRIERELSVLWIVVMLNMLFADIYSIIKVLINKDPIILPGDIDVVMSFAAILTNIPILMIYVSLRLSRRLNKLINIAAALFTIIYIIGGSDLSIHYLICGVIQILVLSLIVYKSIKM